jgi:hypothetical protein
LGGVRRLGVDRAHHLVGDEQVEVARDCRREAVESCVHQQERCAVLTTAVFPVAALVHQVPLVVELRADDSGLQHLVETTPLVEQVTPAQLEQQEHSVTPSMCWQPAQRVREQQEQLAKWSGLAPPA